MNQFIWSTQNKQIHRDRKHINRCQGLVAGEAEKYNGYGFSFRSDENVMGLNRGMVVQYCEY